jgi:hypothetical protein
VKRKAAAKLKNAAHRTAFRGVKTLVETIVAMEFAASFIPFRKSNSNANPMTKITSANTTLTLQKS